MPDRRCSSVPGGCSSTRRGCCFWSVYRWCRNRPSHRSAHRRPYRRGCCTDWRSWTPCFRQNRNRTEYRKRCRRYPRTGMSKDRLPESARVTDQRLLRSRPALPLLSHYPRRRRRHRHPRSLGYLKAGNHLPPGRMKGPEARFRCLTMSPKQCWLTFS